MALKTRDWMQIRQRYERGETYEQLAGEYGVSASAICRHSRAEGWGRRGSARGIPVAGRCVEELTQQMLHVAQAALCRDDGTANVKEMRELAALVRELLTLQRMAREGEETPQQECVRLVLDRQVEDWSV